jgi:spore germination protein GerM
MQDHPSSSAPKLGRSSKRFIPLGLVAGLSTVAITAGGAVAWWTWQRPVPISSTKTESSVSANPQIVKPQPTTQAPDSQASSSQNPTSETASPEAIAEKTVQVYWLKTDSNQIEMAAAPVDLGAQPPNDLLKAAVEQVLTQPTDPAFASAIPEQTSLRKLEVKPDGVHVDFSPEFTSGGGSTSMTGRLGQVIYTATTLDPTAKVWISVEGKPLEVLGGEGLIIDQPMTRESFDQNFQL